MKQLSNLILKTLAKLTEKGTNYTDNRMDYLSCYSLSRFNTINLLIVYPGS